MKLGIITTHPIQYQVPWFRAMSQVPGVKLTVYYCMLPDAKQQGDGFGVDFTWDIPLLEGYRYEVLDNVSKSLSVTTFLGCDTPGIYDIVRAREFDAFIVNGWVAKSCLQLLHACRKYKVPCIVRGESNSLRPRVWWKKFLHRMFLSRYAAFLVIGRVNREFYLQNGVAEEKLFSAPYCIDNDRFARSAGFLTERRDEIRSRWQIPLDRSVFIFCGKFIEKKRPADILEALEKIQTENRSLLGKIHVVMVGDGELRSACEKKVREHGLPVRFIGFLNQGEIVQAYVASDCLVLPSDNGETWGLVVNEAMACGLPALVSDQVGCSVDLVENRQTGAVFPCGDTGALAELMIELGSNPEKLKAMGVNAARLVREYSYEAVVRGTCEALHYVCPDKFKVL